MKFGRNFHRTQVPNWAPFYFDYNTSKRLAKLALRNSTDNKAKDTFIEIRCRLEEAIDSLDIFYEEQQAIIWKKAMAPNHDNSMLWDVIKPVQLAELDQLELRHFHLVITELLDDTRKLLWFGRINRHGICRILEKMHHSRATYSAELQDTESKLAHAQFSRQVACSAVLDHLTTALTKINSATNRGFTKSPSSSLFLRLQMGLPHSSDAIDKLCEAIRQDRLLSPESLLQGPVEIGIDAGAFAGGAFQFALLHGASKSLQTLLAMETLSLEAPLIHHLVIQAGREKTWGVTTGQSMIHASENRHLSTLSAVLSFLASRGCHGNHQDSFGRLPIHYAAQYGWTDGCRVILDHLDPEDGLGKSGLPLMQDFEGATPLQLAVTGGYVEVAKLLLGFCKSTSFEKLSGNFFETALRSGHYNILEWLLEAGVNLQYQNPLNESLLYIAVQFNRVEYVSKLLEDDIYRAHYKDVPEATYGRTPLMLASVLGNLGIVQALLQAGADSTIRDRLGWTAGELAAYRGHISVTKVIKEWVGADSNECSEVPSADHDLRSMESFCPSKLKQSCTNSPPDLLDTKADTHRFSNEKSHILINLGSLNTRKESEAVSLNLSHPEVSSMQYAPPHVSLEISLVEDKTSARTIQLPLSEDLTNKPCVFSTPDVKKAQVMFRVFVGTKAIGNGIALLRSLWETLELSRESLIREQNVPILEKELSRPIGTITFTVLIVTPFMQNKASAPQPHINPWKTASYTQVVGHRGNGQNVAAHSHIQLRENTIQSFNTALLLGASCVEFDVQLTKDHVPVIYHDFLVNETGVDAPVQSLTSEQFINIGKLHSPLDRPSGKKRTRSPNDLEEHLNRPGYFRSRSSDNNLDRSRTKDCVNRMSLTCDFKVKASKANVGGGHVRGDFTTLDEVLRQLPADTPLNIEIKHPMLWEAEDERMDTWVIDVNTFVDAILAKIYEADADRPIIFSSFSPEICIALSLKQQPYPVLFLNDAGLCPVGDSRASSLQEAISFAKRWSLDGLVMASEPFVWFPKLVGYVKSQGLVCASYGALNNEPENAQIQAEAGLDAIIVDNVRLIARIL